jgi:hypothetical protein
MISYLSERLRWASILLLVPLLAGCGGDHSHPAATMAGSWHFVMTSTNLSGQSSNADLFITQSGSAIQSSGSQVIFDRSVCAVLGTMTGSVAGNKITMSIIHADMVDKVNVTATVTGNSLSGTYNTTGQCLNGDEGTITGQMVPDLTSSSWSGTSTSANQQSSFPLSANITEDNQGLLTSTFTFTNGSSCSGVFSFHGSLIGNIVSLKDTTGLEFAGGTVDFSGKHISGLYGCNAGGGIYSLSRP